MPSAVAPRARARRPRCAAASVIPAIVGWAGLFGAIAPAASAQLYQVTASYSMQGSYAADSPATGGGVFPFNDFLTVQSATEAMAAQSPGHSLATDKSAGAVAAQMFSFAKVGELGVSFRGDVAAEVSDVLSGGHGRVTSAAVRAQWKDRLQLASFAPGRQRTVTASIQLFGDMSTDAAVTDPARPSDNRAFAEAWLHVYAAGGGQNIIPLSPYGGPQWAYSGSNTQADAGPPNLDLIAPAFINVIMTMTDGASYPIEFTLDLGGRAFAVAELPPAPRVLTANATWLADYGHTLRWGGITSVVDTLTGEPVTDYALTSASGADYTRPIPEPAAMSLLALGGAGLLTRRRRRTIPEGQESSR